MSPVVRGILSDYPFYFTVPGRTPEVVQRISRWVAARSARGAYTFPCNIAPETNVAAGTGDVSDVCVVSGHVGGAQNTLTTAELLAHAVSLIEAAARGPEDVEIRLVFGIQSYAVQVPPRQAHHG